MQTFRAMISGVVPDDTQFLLRQHVDIAAEAMKQHQARVNEVRLDLQPLAVPALTIDPTAIVFDKNGLATVDLELTADNTVRVVQKEKA